MRFSTKNPRQREPVFNAPDLIDPDKIEGEEEKESVTKESQEGHGIVALCDETATVDVQAPDQVNSHPRQENQHQPAYHNYASPNPKPED